MCELFAMSARHPATVRHSLEEFSRRGGLAGPHKDGWGIAWYDAGDVHLLKEREPASDSACVRLLRERPIESALVMSHIRRATQGPSAVRNCQPFMRELGGRMHVFAHNGDLDPEGLRARLPLGTFRPVGETDSEYAFCALLARLQPAWSVGRARIADRLGVVSGFAAVLRTLGPANFLYADGEMLFAHGHRRMQADGRIAAPGLHVITRQCAQGGGRYEAAGLEIVSEAQRQQVTLFASVPLTGEDGWRALGEGEIVAVHGGTILQSTRKEEMRVHEHAG
jgi:glutamine amidotransferase